MYDKHVDNRVDSNPQTAELAKQGGVKQGWCTHNVWSSEVARSYLLTVKCWELTLEVRESQWEGKFGSGSKLLR